MFRDLMHQMVTRDTYGRLDGAFLSWLSHELRSPLNACVMWLDVLALAPQPDKLAQAVDALKRNLTRQTRLVNDLNDAAKVSSAGIELRLERLDLALLLRRHLDAWQLLAAGKQLSFDRSMELETAVIEGDAERLPQALNHLLESAIGSTPAAGRVALRFHGADGHCIVDIEDTGAPLSAEDVTNLGTPLWRSATAARARAGLGLGLAIAHHIAAKHGGALTAESNPSGGRFRFRLPLAPAPSGHS